MTEARRDEHQGLAEGQAPLTGVFVWQVVEDSWWWSDDLYRIHGFEPGDVVPSTELLLAHKHPEDLPKVRQVISNALGDGQPWNCYHRVVDAQRKVRNVVAVGDSLQAEDGTVTHLRGFLVDLTRQRRDDLQASITAAVEGAAAHRAAIEQAKGALMLAYGIGPDAAFAILRQCSEHANLKLNVLAERLVELFADGRNGAGHRDVLSRLIAISTGLPNSEIRHLADPADPAAS
jgi:hypothetical protein